MRVKSNEFNEKKKMFYWRALEKSPTRFWRHYNNVPSAWFYDDDCWISCYKRDNFVIVRTVLYVEQKLVLVPEIKVNKEKKKKEQKLKNSIKLYENSLGTAYKSPLAYGLVFISHEI